MSYLYEQVNRVPKISDKEIAEMRHIEPVLRVGDYGCVFRRIKGQEKIHPRNTAFNWDAKPTGEEFMPDILDSCTIITQHKCAYFFKPSLDEVYAWIKFYLGDNWKSVGFFCLDDVQQIPGTTDFVCKCSIIGKNVHKPNYVL